MDRPLGTLSRLAAALAVLLAAGAGVPAAAADPGPALAGTPVTGSPSGAKAPPLRTGRYLDRLPATGALHYRLPRTATGSTFHVAVLFVGVGDSVGEGIRIQVGTTAGDQGCGSGGVFRPTLGETDPVLFASVTSWTDVDDHPCAVAPTLHLTVGAPDDDADAGRRFEILVYEEPPLTDFNLDLLPSPEPVPWTSARPAPRPRRVTAGTTPTNAPVVADGSYRVSLRPGRTRVLAVPLDWDQTLQVQLDARLPAGAPAPEGVAVDVVSPLLGTSQLPFTTDRPRSWRVPGPEGGALRLGAQTQVVAYANRDSYDVAVTSESLAGIHYVLVRWTGTEGAAADLAVPATLTLRTSGTAGDGVPAYTPVDGLVGPQPASRLVDGTLTAPPASAPAEDAGHDTDGSGPDRRVLAGGAAGAVLVLAVVLLRRRTRGHPHAGAGRPLGRHDPGGRHRG